MDEKDFPRGLNPLERKEWHKLCNRLFELYHKMPIGETKRKIVAGGDQLGDGNLLIFLKGNQEDALRIGEFIDGMDKSYRRKT